MDVYTARQAIFNVKKRAVAYELLFRDGEENRFPNINPHHATSKLIMRTHLNGGIGAITDGKPALINFTEECIISGFPELLPPDKVIIEILETVVPTDAVFNKCKELCEKGYTLALDDFVHTPEWDRFFSIVKMIKFDIQNTPLKKIAPLVMKLRKDRPKIKLLAERVETHEDFEIAKKMGFSYFQGYFFCKPEMRKSRDVRPEQKILAELYKELLPPSVNMVKVSEFFEQDVGLTYKLLNYINSGVIPIKKTISSIKQALIYLGEEQVRKLLILLTTASMASNKPKEVVRVAIARARACELVAEDVFPQASGEAFLVGLLSQLPAILDKSMEEVITVLPVSEDIKSALLDTKSKNILRIIFDAVTLHEKGSWHLCSLECQKIMIDYDTLSWHMIQSIKWASHYDNVDDYESKTA